MWLILKEVGGSGEGGGQLLEVQLCGALKGRGGLWERCHGSDCPLMYSPAL